MDIPDNDTFPGLATLTSNVILSPATYPLAGFAGVLVTNLSMIILLSSISVCVSFEPGSVGFPATLTIVFPASASTTS